MPIICNAKIAGVQFLEMIHQQPLHGYIHSVFDRVVNIEVLKDSLSDTLFSFGREDVSLAPAMLVTDIGQNVPLGRFGLKQGDWVQLYSGYISTSKLSINTSSVQVWKPVSAAEIQQNDLCSYNELLARINSMIKALSTNNQGASLPYAVFNDAATEVSNDDKSTNRELIIRVTELLQHALNGTYSNEVIDALLGFGLGLTPSGDDIIAGYLHGLSFIERFTCNEVAWKEDMVTKLEQKLSRTNRISRHFLRYAIKGLWSKDIEQFLLDVTSKGIICSLNSAKRLTSFGASSGFDILTGICIGLLAGYSSLMKE